MGIISSVRRNRIRTSPWVHGLNLVVGLLLVLAGLVTGAQGWGGWQIPVLLGLGLAIFSVIGLKVGGIPTGAYVETTDQEDAPSPTRRTREGFAERLRDLEGLRQDGLISEAEYERKREEILRERW